LIDEYNELKLNMNQDGVPMKMVKHIRRAICLTAVFKTIRVNPG